MLLGHGTSRTAWLAAVLLVRAAVLFAPLAGLVLVAACAGVPWDFAGRILAVSGGLVVAFSGIGLCISTFSRTQARALVAVLLVWALAVALLDLCLLYTSD